jgi:hypothetical protein
MNDALATKKIENERIKDPASSSSGMNFLGDENYFWHEA